MLPYWIRKIAHDLNYHEAVEYTRLKPDRLCVRYRSSIMMSYIYNIPLRPYVYSKDIDQSCRIGQDIPIYSEFTDDILDKDNNYDKYFYINRSDITEAEFFAKEILIHKIVDYIMRVGYLKPVYHKNDVLEIFNNLDYYPKDKIILVDWDRDSWKLANYYFDMSEHGFNKMIDIFYNSYLAFKVVNSIVYNRRCDVSINNIMGLAISYGFGMKLPNPAGYKFALQNLIPDIGTRHISDYDCSFGINAICAASLGSSYYSFDTKFKDAVNNGLVDDLDLKYHKPKSIDILVCDNSLQDTTHESVFDILSKVDTLLIFVKGYDIKNWVKKHRPHKMTRVYTNTEIPDYLLIYK